MIYSGYCVKTGLKGRNRRIGWEAVAITQARDSGDLVYSGSSGGEGIQDMWSEGMVSKNC